MASNPDNTPNPSARFRDLPPWLGPLVALAVLMSYTVGHELVRQGHSSFILPQNLLNIANQWSFVGIVAVGMTLVMTLGGIDLSVGSLIAFIGGAGIWMMNTAVTAPAVIESVREAAEIGVAPEHGAARVALARGFAAMGVAGSEAWGVAVALATMLALGPIAGLINGTLIAKGRVSPLIATLGGMAAYRSLALSLADGGEFRSASITLFGRLGQGGVTLPLGEGLKVPFPVFAFLVSALIASVVLNRMRLGRYITAIGCNERAAVYAAVAVDRVKLITYTLLGLSAAVSAALLSSRMNSVSSGQTGAAFELDAIAAVVVGGTRMSGGSGTILGTVIGVFMLGVIGNMLNMLDAPVYLQGLVKGVVIVAAVLIQRRGRAA